MSGFLASLRGLLSGGGDEGAKTAREPEVYKDYLITAEPISEGGQFRLAGRIESQTSGKSHQFIRADVFTNRADAEAAALSKGRRLCDEQGETMFD
ncbi:MAG: transcriptional regulator [Rhizobiales bacterium]|nr:transcriptional regulator [Hyphomicrobiales bacterium]MBA68521.1 transcriptional regulator [Hyphomicrobiales bacterium]|tara:strand:+ start:492 stop:779 length:288 start_codon:yes stop_codon:yes gene_type:complete